MHKAKKQKLSYHYMEEDQCSKNDDAVKGSPAPSYNKIAHFVQISVKH